MPEVMIPTKAEAEAIIKAAPIDIPRAMPASASSMKSLVPPRQIWAAGLSTVIAYLIIEIIGRFGLDIGMILTPLGFTVNEAQTWIAGLIGLAIATFVPPSIADMIKNLNDKIVQIAQRDPESNVSYVLAPVAPPKGEDPVIVPPAPKA